MVDTISHIMSSPYDLSYSSFDIHIIRASTANLLKAWYLKKHSYTIFTEMCIRVNFTFYADALRLLAAFWMRLAWKEKPRRISP